ncbi:MAG: hypothetical protein AB7U46_17005, partial [Paenirhodobacter sp.]|uniref:hypothetical protein n=1 Tax=Paenirhodobacter sp. TaxID=1965326 RepID=UPI003D0CC88F
SEEAEEAASEPAPSEPVAPEPEARAEAEDDAEEASAAAEDRAEEPEALSADAIAAEDEALDRLEARRRRRAERRAARAAEEAQAAEEAAAQAATEEAARIAEEAEEAARAEAEAAERAAEAQAKAEAEAREAAEAAARAEAEAAARAAEAEAKAQAEAEAAAKAAEEAQAEAEPETPALPVAEQPRPTIRARVIKVRRADALRLTAAEVPAAPNDSGLTPEQEAELLAELAMLEGEDEDAPVLETVAETAAVAEEPAASTEEFDIEAFAAAQAEAEQIEAPEPAALREMLEDDEIAALIAAQQAPEAAAAMAEPVAEETVAEEPVEEEAILEAVPAEEPVEAPFVAEEPVAEEIVAEEPAEETVAEVAEQPAAEIAIEIAEEIEEEAPAEPVAARRPEVHLTGAARPSQPPPLPETDLSRLMDKADAQLSGSENRRRISAIAHLKAAVAATVADRRAGASAAPEDETRPYREDLTHAVRPRRPVSAAHAATPRPTPVEARPAPLVLVSEQRVDRNPTEAQVQAAAIRPRRISAAQIHHEEIEGFDAEEATPEAPMNPAEAASFAEFAESLGTQGLSDLLEAAAAYTAQIEGRPHFSPPQIMRKLSAIGPEGDFSREDRLRVFGKLLRQGKIAKVKRGQYAITEASQYYGKRA